MTRHDNYVLEEWLTSAVEEHEEGADTSSLPPAYVVDLILELRHHRAAADEAAWNHQRAEEAEEEEIAYAHAQAHAQKAAPIGPFQMDQLYSLPREDGNVWATQTGGKVQWVSDLGQWLVEAPNGEDIRVGPDKLPDVLTPADFPLTHVTNL